MQELLARLGDKWSMLVIMALAKNEIYCLRFSDLRKQVNGISQRMLTTTLRYRSSPDKTGQKHLKKREE